jgi:hypothetical protein
MNIFFSVVLLLIFIFSLRFIDKSCWMKLKEDFSEQENKALKDLRFSKNDKKRDT